jgi:hypothetical protein
MFKKLLSFTFIFVTVAGLNAQQINLGSAIEADKTIASKVNPGPASTVIDTLKPATVMAGGCGLLSGGLVYYGINLKASNRGTASDSGYFFGNGKFPQAGITITGLAQKYNVGSSAATVTTVLILAAKGKGGTTTSTAYIYSTSATTKAPTTSLGASTPLAMSAFSATTFTKYVFPTPVNVPANTVFAAGLSVPAFGGTDKDTLCILDTKQGCSSTDSLSWLQVNSTQWAPVTALFGKPGNVDFMIFPVIDITTGINNFVSKGDLSIYAASPNPAINSINIPFSINNSGKVEIEVYDINGQVVKNIQAGDNFNAGRGSINLDVTSLDAGTYIYSVNANGNKMFSRFVVTK